jgi:hypothetical protein
LDDREVSRAARDRVGRQTARLGARPHRRALQSVARADVRAHEPDGKRLNHTLGIASLGGATFGIEENYLLQKLFKSAGVVSVENQARI